MICRAGEILKIRVEGVPLGLLDSREYEEAAFQAAPGDTIVLYSDGITDHIGRRRPRLRPRPPVASSPHALPEARRRAGAAIFDTWTGSPPPLSTTNGVRHEGEVSG